jgi:hypothetical protein
MHGKILRISLIFPADTFNWLIQAHQAMSQFTQTSDTHRKQQLVYLDALNYTTEFILLHDWHCSRALARVQRFVDAAKTSGITIKAFLDEGTVSAEAGATWKSRRVREIVKGEKNVPQGAAVLLGDMLRKCGVEVCYSSERDNDDTLAFHAEADGASILSHDQDMFRYVGHTYTVYSDFQIERGRLHLTEHRMYASPSKLKSGPRELEPPPAYHHTITHVREDGVYLRGVPSPLVRALGYNPHGVVAPLRHAMYHKLGMQGPLIEEWPEWSAEKNAVVWVRHEDVQPNADAELAQLLSQPDEAMMRFFPAEVTSPAFPPPGCSASKRDWAKHVMCVRSVVYEICVMSNPGGPTLLDLMLAYEASLARGRSGGEAARPISAHAGHARQERGTVATKEGKVWAVSRQARNPPPAVDPARTTTEKRYPTASQSEASAWRRSAGSDRDAVAVKQGKVWAVSRQPSSSVTAAYPAQHSISENKPADITGRIPAVNWRKSTNTAEDALVDEMARLGVGK